MQYKEPSDDMKDFVARAQLYWEQVDVDALQPVLHGLPPSEEEMRERAQRMAAIEQLQRQYEEQKQQEFMAALQLAQADERKEE